MDMKRSSNALAIVLAGAAVSCASEARRAATDAGPLPTAIQNGDVQLAFSLDLPDGNWEHAREPEDTFRRRTTVRMAHV
jgi:hypothetical protein